MERLVSNYKVDILLAVADEDKKIIRNLQRLLYSVDKRIRWRSADILGKVSAVIAGKNPGIVAKLLQRLITSVIDTAASSWGGLNAAGEIISNNPQQFGGYIPHLFQFAADRQLLPDVLSALGKISAGEPDLIRGNTFRLIPLLQDPDPEVRGFTVVLLGNLGAREAGDDLKRLQEDSNEMEIYRDGEIETKTVGQLASEALEKI